MIAAFRTCSVRSLDRVIALAVLAALAILWSAAGALAADDFDAWPDPDEMQFERITFNPETPERFELANGMVVYFLENRNLPIVKGAIYLRAGSLVESKDQVGLADLTADLIRTGGTESLSPEAVDEELDFIAASVSVSPSLLFTSVSFASLSEFSGRTFEIVSDLLQRPAFAPDRLEVARGRYLEAIRRQNDNPVEIALREFFHRLAADHPAGAYMTEEIMRSLTRDDVVAFYRNHYRPDGAVVVVSGDIDRDTLREQLERTIGTWQVPAGEPVPPPPFNPAPEPKVYHAQKGTTQSVIVIGYPALMLTDPDFAPLAVANRVLGGGNLQDRLATEIRARRGLAYVTQSTLTEGHAFPGFFYALAISRADATAQVIELIKAEIQRLIDEPIPADELVRNREAILNRAVFRFATPADVVRTAALAEMYGLPADYFERYIERIQSLTADDIQAAVRRWLDPDRMITLVVGDAAQFDRPLDVFGEVESIVLD